MQGRLTADIEALLSETGEAAVYAPLAIGHHVDHQLVRDVALALQARVRRTLFYEDFPYVWWEIRERSDEPSPQQPAPRPAVLPPGDWKPALQAVDVEPKIAAIACYTSQIPDLFGDEAAMADAVREYAWAVGGDHAAERFWKLVSSL
ncbi:MAG: hypothetical protein D6791_06045 [Chloroflexi bacterium]|nr:MAG: hypothetical protein D6791_06045 [Chloroflexota bacterium]